MSNLPLRQSRDPFATLVTLTAAALGAMPPATSAVARAGERTVARRVSLLDRLDRWLWNARQRDLERALATATDAAELENRLRARERGLLYRYY